MYLTVESSSQLHVACEPVVDHARDQRSVHVELRFLLDERGHREDLLAIGWARHPWRRVCLMVVAIISRITSDGVTPGLNWYVDGNSHPSRLPFASAGSPSASVSSAAALTVVQGPCR